jgi:phosphoenolpyruvate-protein kinase (PTS system EI component)
MGTPGAPGIAVGPVWRPGVEGSAGGAEDAGVAGRQAAEPEGRIRMAAAAAAAQLETLAARLCKMDRIGEAEILEAQALMAVDPALVDEAVRLVAAGLDPAGALVLVGLGVDELSADAGSLDGIRVALEGVTGAEFRDLAACALAATDAETVRRLAGELLARG